MATSAKPERPAYEVKLAKTRDEVEACLDIRVEVFHVEQGFSMDSEIDEWDKEAVHILLTTTSPSPPATSTSSLTPWLQTLSASVLSLLPDSFTTSSTSPSTSADEKANELEKKETTQIPIGTVRYVPKTNKLSRLAIMKEYRKYGYGRVLVEELERAAALAGREGKTEVKEGKVLIKCHSQDVHRELGSSKVYVIPFYEKLGYTPEGERFDEEGAPHQKLTKTVSI